MKKLYAGNEPKGGTVIAETRTWLLFEKRRKCGWVSIKLVSKIERRRANYALAWSQVERRLALCSDSIALNADLPEMYDWVSEVMSQESE